ncbi:MAG: rod shape-determining protein MreC, partial [Patescibacteria group bacterium]|nr:rod shape-determining protein MreC [Patescibacteria group bacterium]
MNLGYFRKNLIKLILGVVMSLFLILIDGMGWAAPVYDWGNYLLEPVEYWTSRMVVGIDHFISTIWEIGSLRSRNADLEVDNALLRAELGELKEIREENAALRQQVGVEMTMGWNLNLARVLGIDIQRFAGYVLIDAGRDENIDVGDAVVLGNILIGEVRDVYKSTARVRLVSNQNSNIMGVAQETRAKGLVHGSLDGIVME